MGETFARTLRIVPGMVLILLFAKLHCTVISGELFMSRPSWLFPKVRFSYSYSNALAYKSSCFLMTSRSGFHSFDVVCTSHMGCPGVNKRSLIRLVFWVLSVPTFRIKHLLFGNTFSPMYEQVRQKTVRWFLLAWWSAWGS